MNNSNFIDLLNKLNIKYNEECLEKLEIYKDFLQEYNKHTNLTTIISDEDIYIKHFYDSLTITKVINLDNVTNLLDLGTGAGFPGMVIKIFFPNINVTLLDSNNKKIKFLEELSKKLDIKVDLINDRVENYSKNNLNTFDIVTSRAVANLRVLSELALPLVKENGYFIPLKASVEEEIKNAKNTLKYFNAKIIKQETFDEYGIRNILLIEKNSKSTLKEVRDYSKIIKKPL